MNWLLFLFITSFLTFLFITFLFVNFLCQSLTPLKYLRVKNSLPFLQDHWTIEKKICRFSSFNQCKTKKLPTSSKHFLWSNRLIQLVSRNLRLYKSVDYRRLFVCEVLSQINKNEIIRKQMIRHDLSYNRIPLILTKRF